MICNLTAGILSLSLICLIGLPAHADQFLQAADNATLNGLVSKKEVTRISFTGDDAASLQKIKPTNPSDDFSVIHDPVTGDMYVTLPIGYRSKFVNFFATSKRGFTYKFILRVSDIPATQIFVQNPSLGSKRAAEFERAQPYRETLVKLTRSMWNRSILPGYKITWKRQNRRAAGPIKYRQIGSYQGNNLIGRLYEIGNSSRTPLTLSENIFKTKDTLAVTFQERILAPKATTTVFVILSRQGGDHDGE